MEGRTKILIKALRRGGRWMEGREVRWRRGRRGKGIRNKE